MALGAGVEQLQALEENARAAIAEAETPQGLIEVRAQFLGRKGSVSTLLRSIGSLDASARAAVGKAANATKVKIESWVKERRSELQVTARATRLAEHRLDVSLPGVRTPRGGLHPITRLMREMSEFFQVRGFSIETGPEVETDWNNFGALNFPEDHPARDMHDTIFVEGDTLLRTHTSPVQIRAMSEREPPFRFIAPGRVYRHDSDATHSPMFHQIEGFLVDDRVTFGDLKGLLYDFARHLMGAEVKLRFRASYFPFTEPSAELDFSWEGGWLEWGGCGMIHPRVLQCCGIDPEQWQGFAFGMGIDRTVMQRLEIPNIRILFDPDLRVLDQVQ